MARACTYLGDGFVPCAVKLAQGSTILFLEEACLRVLKPNDQQLNLLLVCAAKQASMHISCGDGV